MVPTVCSSFCFCRLGEMAKAITLQQNYIDKLGDQALDLIQSDVALLLLRVIVVPVLISTLQFVW